MNCRSFNSDTTTSNGRDSHVPHTDRDLDTVRNITTLNIAIMIVRTLYQKRERYNIKQEEIRLRRTIMGVCDVRWTAAGPTAFDHYTVIYLGYDKHERWDGIMMEQEPTKSLL